MLLHAVCIIILTGVVFLVVGWALVFAISVFFGSGMLDFSDSKKSTSKNLFFKTKF